MWPGALCLWVLVFASAENIQVTASSPVPSFSTRPLSSTSRSTPTSILTHLTSTSTSIPSATVVAVPAFAHHANLVRSASTLGRLGSTSYSRRGGGGGIGGDSPIFSSFCSSSSTCCSLPEARSVGLKASMGSGSRRRRRAGKAATAISSGARLLGTVLDTKKDMDGDEKPNPVSPPAPVSPRTLPAGSGGALSAAALCRGGGGDDSDSKARGRAVASAAKAVRGGALLLDKVEDVVGDLADKLRVVLFPLFHLARLAFGLSLMFYGMAFRTFAFHVIVFRIAGFKQVRGSLGEIVTSYRGARKTIREAASAAGSMGDRVVHGDDLKVRIRFKDGNPFFLQTQFFDPDVGDYVTKSEAAREAMIAEKERLLADGFLSAEDTRYFMSKYHTELMEIKKEQDRFKSARSSIISVRSSVDPKVARASLGGVYSALMASFTASSIQTAGQITLGLHIGSLLKTHILDLFGPILDPIGYRLDLDTYYDNQDIPYMGKANAMDGPSNMFLNVLCYSIVFIIIRVHPSTALKAAMVYYGARVVTDYVIVATEPFRRRHSRSRKFGQMTIIHTPWSAVVHIGLTALGFYLHRNIVHTAGAEGIHPLLFGPGAVGLVEPVVRLVVKVSHLLHHIDFFKVKFVADPIETVKAVAQRVA